MVSGEEAEAILLKATHANSQGSSRKSWHGRRGADNRRTPRVDSDYVYKERPKKVQKDKYLLVDGYNLIFAWPELKSLMMSNADSARDSLNDILCKYQSIRHINLIVVYDAYRVAGHNENYFDFNNIHVVFTKEAETADRYIERFSHEHGKTYDITVVTSDALEQIITLGAGCTIMSSREFIRESELANEELRGFLK